MTTSIEKSASIVGAIAITAMFYSLCFTSESSASPKTSALPAIQTITISAKQMTSVQKTNYDKEQANTQIQTIVISAKHMSVVEKNKFDEI